MNLRRYIHHISVTTGSIDANILCKASLQHSLGLFFSDFRFSNFSRKKNLVFDFSLKKTWYLVDRRRYVHHISVTNGSIDARFCVQLLCNIPCGYFYGVFDFLIFKVFFDFSKKKLSLWQIMHLLGASYLGNQWIDHWKFLCAASFQHSLGSFWTKFQFFEFMNLWYVVSQ